MKTFDSFCATLVALLWGCNFVAAKYGVAFFPPFLLTALRFTFVSLCWYRLYSARALSSLSK